MDRLISELVSYGMTNELIAEDDKVYVINRLLELFDKKDFVWSDEKVRSIHMILADMMKYAIEKGIMEDETITSKDLFDTKIMGLITPMPSQVREKFKGLYTESPKLATDYYYKLSQDTNYIRRDRIEKDEKWTTETEYGQIDITINLSKPEKDPRDIAFFVKRTKDMRDIFLIRQDKIIELFRLSWLIMTIIFSIHHTFTIMNIV